MSMPSVCGVTSPDEPPLTTEAGTLVASEANEAVTAPQVPEPAPLPIAAPRPIAPLQRVRTIDPLETLFLRRTGPLTWVFAGDAYLAGIGADDQLTPLVKLFADEIRGWSGRQSDRMIDVLSRDAIITRLLAAWEKRIAAHQPHVVVLLFGHQDAKAGMRGFDAFEDALEAVLLRCRDMGITCIVNTPPCLPDQDENLLADRLIYLEAIRATAKTYDAILIDHWDEWEWAAIEVGGIEAWYEQSGQYPGPEGHRQMTNLFAEALGRGHENTSPVAPALGTKHV